MANLRSKAGARGGTGVSRVAKRGRTAGLPEIPKELKGYLETGRVKVYKKYPFPVSMDMTGIDALITFTGTGPKSARHYLETQGIDMLMEAAIHGAGNALSVGFQKQIGPNGEKWPPISPMTKAKRAEMGYDPEAAPLVRGGALQQAVSEFLVNFKGQKGVNRRYTGKRPAGTKARPETIRVDVTITGSSSSGIIGKRALLQISGPGVANNEPRSFSVNGKSVHVPARRFWYIDNRVKQEILNGILNGTHSINTGLAGIAPRRVQTAKRKQEVYKRFERQRLEQILRSDTAGMTPDERLTYINNTLRNFARSERVGENFLKMHLFRTANRKKQVEDPFRFFEFYGSLSLSDISNMLEHRSGARITTGYRQRDYGDVIVRIMIKNSSDREGTQGRLPGTSWLTFNMNDETQARLFVEYKSRHDVAQRPNPNDRKNITSALTSAKEGDIIAFPGTEKAWAKHLDAIYNEAKLGVNNYGQTKIRAYKIWKLQADWTLALRKKGIKSEIDKTIIPYNKIGRVDIAAALPLDTMAKEFIFAMTAYAVKNSSGNWEIGIIKLPNEPQDMFRQRGRELAERRAAGRELGHKFGDRPGDAILIMRGERQQLLERLRSEYPNKIPDIPAGTWESRRGKMEYIPSQEELQALYAPFGVAVVPSRFTNGMTLSDMVRTVEGDIRQRMVRYAVATNIKSALPAGPSGEAITRMVVQDWLGHMEPTTSAKYYTTYAEPGGLMTPRHDEGSASKAMAIPGFSQSESDVALARYRQILFAERFISERLTSAWIERSYAEMEEIVRRTIGLRTTGTALDVNSPEMKSIGTRMRDEILAMERQRDIYLTRLAGLDLINGEPQVFGPRYFSRYRELGWLPEYSTGNKAMFGGAFNAGIALSNRPQFLIPGRAFEAIPGTENGPFGPEFRSVNRPSVDWFKYGSLGLRLQDMESDILHRQVDSWPAEIAGTLALIKAGDKYTGIDASDIMRDGRIKNWFKYVKKTEAFKARGASGYELWGKTFFTRRVMQQARFTSAIGVFQLISTMQRENPEWFSDLTPSQYREIYKIAHAEWVSKVDSKHNALRVVNEKRKEFFTSVSERGLSASWLDKYGMTTEQRMAQIESYIEAMMPATRQPNSITRIELTVLRQKLIDEYVIPYKTEYEIEVEKKEKQARSAKAKARKEARQKSAPAAPEAPKSGGRRRR